jgi:hypothetical protein
MSEADQLKIETKFDIVDWVQTEFAIGDSIAPFQISEINISIYEAVRMSGISVEARANISYGSDAPGLRRLSEFDLIKVEIKDAV